MAVVTAIGITSFQSQRRNSGIVNGVEPQKSTSRSVIAAMRGS
jgi:hypothetical protein